MTTKERAGFCACGVVIPPGREACSKCLAGWAEIDHLETVRPMLEDAIGVLLREYPRALRVGAYFARASLWAVNW